mmetsp:Transcript_24435/g.35725  ORF Transcript_24435/g.35725 Transcript_24435/m.35725 type:complete len:92 (+) Transcript_24435:224-499(+)|eukprot:CAMPEP_0195530010 /NCGR_PEP_ID=MMETSP0794_2-20130614/32711_1 /TAXON_ID=515487 /ORGANISM="Stephanopyxis turris, Strain CCMP 815" /LENGTH=91 /DNA_ID=CAMNT_0040661405 /DNA_START=223 /DNA_END=498 /DNA_ORIENTATION=-
MSEADTKNGQSVELKDVAVTETDQRRRVVWADSKNQELTSKMVSNRLHYSVNYNGSSFSNLPVANDDAGGDDPSSPTDPGNPKVENCCVIA